ncbi:tegument protein VP11/12 [Testudinid alphaherpesvirus 3]|uniref:Tegument protein n=1 Tax=Testudinid alphaherpesvirus 3 TaxID=2560801 RepID=A0A0K1R1Z9_9ALPH|nr:tegument protein VP11/12 [Testudinid alphaherpesvirus 3]AIU39255.1 tegument protein VP11/12 [Testudinid alphaherpesvirus 3]AIU39365.1 tegument protein VP11/12 [Testudinid alphaherpesvirus 3]AKI81641.1 tegument protein VP11/12 [Testudinid alphaherpesvirus 3]AKI81745.1 tegument protein VP11/12 [Testudinid alphaherpesvirus 3]AKV40726.1 tegument protein [Testudinid alphaherpesvirus 3]
MFNQSLKGRGNFGERLCKRIPQPNDVMEQEILDLVHSDRENNYRQHLTRLETSLQRTTPTPKQLYIVACSAYNEYAHSVRRIPVNWHRPLIPLAMLTIIKRFSYCFGDSIAFYPSGIVDDVRFQNQWWTLKTRMEDVEKYLYYCSPNLLDHPSPSTSVRIETLVIYAASLVRFCALLADVLDENMAKQYGHVDHRTRETSGEEILDNHTTITEDNCIPTEYGTEWLRYQTLSILQMVFRMIDEFKEHQFPLKSGKMEMCAKVLFFFLYSLFFHHATYIFNSIRTLYYWWLPERSHNLMLQSALGLYCFVSESISSIIIDCPTLNQWQDEEKSTLAKTVTMLRKEGIFLNNNPYVFRQYERRLSSTDIQRRNTIAKSYNVMEGPSTSRSLGQRMVRSLSLRVWK